MSKTLYVALAIAVFPALVIGKNPSEVCALANQLQQAELPQDIAVRTDRMTSAATKIAMDWWTTRLSTPARPITWHVVVDAPDCMIYIRFGWDNMTANKPIEGYTHMPNDRKFDGLAVIKRVDPWVIAHEIGHLIGCAHGLGVMRREYAAGKTDLWIDDNALHYALLIRLKASGVASGGTITWATATVRPPRY
jgi:hypothetical protein